LRKSNRNCVKDAAVVHGPIPACELDDQFVYERLIDSRVPGLGLLQLRPTVIGGTIVTVRRTLHPDWFCTGRLDETVRDRAIVYPDAVFSPEEQQRITAFCAAMALDFGALDMLRDIADGRIYIVDANNTPSSWDYNAWRLGWLAQACGDHFPAPQRGRLRALGLP
jgi:hypothetical protein